MVHLQGRLLDGLYPAHLTKTKPFLFGTTTRSMILAREFMD
jgi:hypothetical protein